MHRYLTLIVITCFSIVAQAATFELKDENTEVVGHNLIVFSRTQDTLLDIARRFDLGYTEITNANPDLDVWLPGKNQQVIVPNQFILPDTERKGIVINLAEMRLYYFPEAKKGEKRYVITHPIGIGREGWTTPVGKTSIIQKRKDPTWTPPASIIAEHLEMGDPLPKVVPAGPDNPLGAFAMRLGMPGYLLHGTNRPYGVGLRVSHGCIRLFPEDIEHLFGKISLNTPVEIIYQPYKAAIHQNRLYVEAHETHDDMNPNNNNMTPMVSAIVKAKDSISDDDWLFAQNLIDQHHGVVKPIDHLEMSFVVKDIWFIHTGLASLEEGVLETALTTLEIDDRFWPIKGAEGEILLGPFDDFAKTEKLAFELSQLIGQPAWVTLVESDVL